MKEWKVYPLNDNYEVSTDGEVRNKSGRILKQRLDSEGYSRLNLSKNGKQKTVKVHRMVAAAFIDEFDSEYTVDHINGIRSDNRLVNLRVLTAGDNISTMITNRRDLNAIANEVIKKIGYDEFEKVLKNILENS